MFLQVKASPTNGQKGGPLITSVSGLFLSFIRVIYTSGLGKQSWRM